MKIIKVVAFITAFLNSSSASSELIEKYWEGNSDTNNTSLTLDTSSRLEWLDLSYTEGMSWNQVNEMTMDGPFKGFRLATLKELMNFLEKAGIKKSGLNPKNVGEWDNMRALIDLIGSTYETGVVIGRYDDPKCRCKNTHNRWGLRALPIKGYTLSYPYGKVSDNARWVYSTGSFLVR